MKVRAKEPITYGANASDIRRYEPGDALEVSEAIGSSLLASGAAEALAEDPAPSKPKRGDK